MKRLIRILSVAAVLALVGIDSAYGKFAYSLTYKDDKSFDGLRAAKWNGWVFNGTGKVIGTLQVSCGKATAAGYKIKATAILMGYSKKLSFTKVAEICQLDTKTGLVAGRIQTPTGESMTIRLSQYNVFGQITCGSETYDYDCGRDFAADKNEQRAAMIAQWQGNYVMAAWAEPSVGSFRGFVGLTIKITNKGKATIKGTLPDGNTISTTAQAVYDDQYGLFLPIYAQLYGKKGAFGGFLLCISKNLEVLDNKKLGTGFWDGYAAKTPRYAALTFMTLERVTGSTGPSPSQIYAIRGFTAQGGVGTVFGTYDGQEIMIDTVPGTALTYVNRKFTPVENASKLKLSYKDKTGELTGSFKLQTKAGKTYTAKIVGVFAGKLGLMTGLTKEKGSLGLVVQ